MKNEVKLALIEVTKELKEAAQKVADAEIEVERCKAQLKLWAAARDKAQRDMMSADEEFVKLLNAWAGEQKPEALEVKS